MDSNYSNKINLFSDKCMMILAFYPILSYYSFFNEFTYADIVSLILLLIGISKYGMLSYRHFRFPTVFTLYWGFMAVSQIINAESIKITTFIPGGVTFFVWIIQTAVYACFFDFDKYKKYLNWLFYFVAVLFVIQYSLKNTGRMVPMFLPLGRMTSYGGMTYAELIEFHQNATRCVTIFPETSYMGQFCALVLAVNLFCKENIGKLLSPIICVDFLIILLLGSGSGLLVAFILIILKVTHLIIIQKNKKYFAIILFMLPLLYYVLNYYFLSDVGSAVMGRTSEMSEDGSSGYLRLISGYTLLSFLDPFQLIVGAKAAFMDSVIYNGNIFVNGIATYLIRNGIIGSVLVLFTLLRSTRSKDFIVSAIVVFFISLSAIEATYMREFTMGVFALILGYRNQVCYETE